MELSEKQLKEIIRNVMQESVEGYTEWLKEETIITDITTHKEILNCEITMKEGRAKSMTYEYIFPRLKKHGITFTQE